MVKKMKHIKLFENWAEEIEVPVYLRGDNTTTTIHNPDIQLELKKEVCDIGNNTNLHFNFKHFSEIAKYCREDGYNSFRLSQAFCRYRLQDFNEMPDISYILHLHHTDIRSLKGLENRKIENSIVINNSDLENLKYCPTTYVYDFKNNPLLSYWGIPLGYIENFDHNVTGYKFYDVNKMTPEQTLSLEFHANEFSNSKQLEEKFERSFKVYKPWNDLYNDPRDVENFEFLFLPFWKSSEKFREKAPIMIENLDMSDYERRNDEELW